MKKTLLLFFSIFSFNCFAQLNGYIYKIKLQDVDNFGAAKDIAYVLQEKFQYFPSFNDSTDRFELYSPLNIAESDFNILISAKGYVLLYFEQQACIKCEIEEEE